MCWLMKESIRLIGADPARDMVLCIIWQDFFGINACEIQFSRKIIKR